MHAGEGQAAISSLVWDLSFVVPTPRRFFFLLFSHAGPFGVNIEGRTIIFSTSGRYGRPRGPAPGKFLCCRGYFAMENSMVG